MIERTYAANHRLHPEEGDGFCQFIYFM